MNSTLDEANDEGDILGVDNKTWIQWVRHGDIIRLDHVATMPRRLHSHDEKPPVTDLEYHKEVRYVALDGSPIQIFRLTWHATKQWLRLPRL